MNTVLQFNLLLPIALLVLQSLVLTFAGFALLKRFKVLKTPYSGLEYSQVVIASAILLGIFLVSMADITALFQSFKTYQNTKANIFSGTFAKFSQFFMTVLFFEMLFALIVAFVIRLVLGFKNPLKEFEEGNLPAALLLAVVLVCFSLVLQLCAREIIEYMIPQYFNFR